MTDPALTKLDITAASVRDGQAPTQGRPLSYGERRARSATRRLWPIFQAPGDPASHVTPHR